MLNIYTYIILPFPPNEKNTFAKPSKAKKPNQYCRIKPII